MCVKYYFPQVLCIHYLFSFVLVSLAIIHLIALYEDGLNNPIGVKSESDKGSFHSIMY